MKKIMLTALFSGTLLFSHHGWAHYIQLNQPLPAVTVSEDGELVLNNNDISYKKWQSQELVGKVRVVQHFAGRTAAKEKNEHLVEAIKAAHFSPNKYQTTSIINADDAIIGTGPFVKSSAEKGKKQNAHSQVILDQQGEVKNKWGLQAKDSAIIVLDQSGKVRFVKEGKLSDSEINDVIRLVNELSR